MRALSILSLFCVIGALLLACGGIAHASMDIGLDGGDDLLAGLVSENKQVKILTSANFEHDTQASTGMTTGDWFVLFYADFCGHCRHVKPAFEELAKLYDQHQTSIAMVDAQEAGDLRRRFNVKGFPTMILFRGKKMYRYVDHHNRNVEGFTKFLTNPIESSGAEAEAIPAPMSIVDEALFVINTVELSDFIAVYDESPTLFIVMIGMVVIANVLLIVSCLAPFICKPPSKSGAAPKTSVERKQK